MPGLDPSIDILKLDKSSISGYYAKKNKFKVGNLNDFIHKLRRVNVLDRYLSQAEPDYCGISTLYEDFLKRVQTQLSEDPLLKGDLLTHMEEINEYVMN